MGLDDLRRFNELTRSPMPIWAQTHVLEDVRRIFCYALTIPDEPGGGVPSYNLFEITDHIEIAGIPIETFEVLHGRLPVLGLRVGNLAYLTDVSEIPLAILDRLESLRTLIIDATRIAPHPTHFHLERSLEVAKLIGAETTYLTHLSHDYDYEKTNAELPPSVQLSFDGLRIPVSLE
jgi:phosphoribosyl 1,2-cyclic phosphate phosphodiesterase